MTTAGQGKFPAHVITETPLRISITLQFFLYVMFIECYNLLKQSVERKTIR